MSETQLFLKFIHAAGTGGWTDFKWPLPRGKRPGAWTERLGPPLSMCIHGYHVLRPRDVVPYRLSYSGSLVVSGRFRCFLAECETADMTSKTIYGSETNKVAVRRARLLREIPWESSDFASNSAVRRWLKRNGVKVVG